MVKYPKQADIERMNKKIELTKHTVISRSVAYDGILKSHQEFCASILVIVDQRNGGA